LRDIIIVSVHARNELHALDPADPARALVRLQSVGSRPVLRPFAALEYAPNIARLVYFSPLDDGVVYTIAGSPKQDSGNGAIDEWTWQAHQPAAGTLQPISDAAGCSRFTGHASHVFGRFRIATFGKVDVAVLVRHVDTPVYVWRLS
jgi:hypothetical protein